MKKKVFLNSFFLRARGFKALLITLSVLLGASSLSSAETLPLDDFLKHSDYLDVKISPDGKHLAARLRENERVFLTLIRLEDGKPVGGVNPRIHNEVRNYYWVNNERVIYSIAEKRSGRDRPSGTGELFGISVDGRQSKMLAGYRASDERGNTRISNKTDTWASFRLISTLTDDPKNVLIAEYRWELEDGYYRDTGKTRPIVSTMNVNTGRKRKVEMIDFPGARLYANAKGEIHYLTYYTEEATREAYFRTSTEEPWIAVKDEFDTEARNAAVYGVNDAGNKVYLDMTDPEHGVDSLYELNLDTRQIRKLFNNTRADVQTWMTDLKNEIVIGASFPDKTHYFYDDQSDSNVIKLHKMLRRAFGDQVVSVRSMDSAGDNAIIKVHSDTNPGEYYLFDTSSKQAQFLFANYSWIDPRKMRPKTSISFSARDGLEIHGYLTLPTRSNENEKVPLIVLPHGGPHFVRDFPFFDWETQLLANRGYAVLQPNFRGSGGYGLRFTQLGYREWAGDMISDIIDATNHVLENNPIDASRVCIFGHSYGAYAAMMASSQEPDLYRCTIGSAGLYDLTNIHEDSLAVYYQGGPAYLIRSLGTDPEVLKANSPVSVAGKIESDILLIHGRKDTVTTQAQFESMSKALKDSNKKFESLVIKTAGHGPYNLENRQAQYTKILDFLDERIGSR